MKKWVLSALISVLAAGAAQALAPDSSIRPEMRKTPAVIATSGRLADLRPVARPPSDQQVQLAAARPSAAKVLGPGMSPRPVIRPDAIPQKAMSRKREQRRGSVCDNIGIQGEVVGFVPGRIAACGIPEAVQITSVAGVTLSQPSLMDCTTAEALHTWVERGVKPEFRQRGPVVQLQVAAHYACRTRNHQPGARISEHGKGRAIDISGFVMADGEVITISQGWGQGTTLRLLRNVHRAACGPFGTVLGPESDRFHQNHFHLDTARYRGGPYCR